MKKSLLFLVFSMAAGSTAYAQTGPKAKEVNIVSFKHTGDGCPEGSVETIVTPQSHDSKNADYFQIVYDKFEIHSGPDVSIGERSNRCNLTIKMEFPKGYRFKFEHSSFSGSAEIEKGLTAEFKTNYRRPLESKFASLRKIKGPFEGDFDVDETGKNTGGIFSGCDGSDIIQIEGMLRFKGKRSLEGKVFRDIQSGSFIQQHRFQWEKC